MLQRFKKYSLEKQVFLSFSLATTLILVVTLCLILVLEINRQQEDLDNIISSNASYIASLDEVVTMLERGYPNSLVTARLDKLHQNFSTVDIIAIYNCDGSRFYHTDRSKTGETFVAGEESAILEGAPPYITTGYGTHGTQHKAFHAVKNDDGAIVGFVTVAVFPPPSIRKTCRWYCSFWLFCVSPYSWLLHCPTASSPC